MTERVYNLFYMGCCLVRCCWRTSHRQWWDKNKYIRPTLWGVAVCHILSLGPAQLSLSIVIYLGERMSSIYNNKRRLIYTQKALYYYYNGMYICIAFILLFLYECVRGLLPVLIPLPPLWLNSEQTAATARISIFVFSIRNDMTANERRSRDFALSLLVTAWWLGYRRRVMSVWFIEAETAE